MSSTAPIPSKREPMGKPRCSNGRMEYSVVKEAVLDNITLWKQHVDIEFCDGVGRLTNVSRASATRIAMGAWCSYRNSKLNESTSTATQIKAAIKACFLEYPGIRFTEQKGRIYNVYDGATCVGIMYTDRLCTMNLQGPNIRELVHKCEGCDRYGRLTCTCGYRYCTHECEIKHSNLHRYPCPKLPTFFSHPFKKVQRFLPQKKEVPNLSVKQCKKKELDDWKQEVIAPVYHFLSRLEFGWVERRPLQICQETKLKDQKPQHTSLPGVRKLLVVQQMEEAEASKEKAKQMEEKLREKKMQIMAIMVNLEKEHKERYGKSSSKQKGKSYLEWLKHHPLPLVITSLTEEIVIIRDRAEVKKMSSMEFVNMTTGTQEPQTISIFLELEKIRRVHQQVFVDRQRFLPPEITYEVFTQKCPIPQVVFDGQVTPSCQRVSSRVYQEQYHKLSNSQREKEVKFNISQELIELDKMIARISPGGVSGLLTATHTMVAEDLMKKNFPRSLFHGINLKLTIPSNQTTSQISQGDYLLPQEYTGA